MCRAYFHSVANKKKMTSVIEKIGFSAAQANILNVLGKLSFIRLLLVTNSPDGELSHLLTLTLISDDLESHIVANVSSTLTNTTIWFVAALSLIVDVWTDGRTDRRMDIFTGFIRSSLRR